VTIRQFVRFKIAILNLNQSVTLVQMVMSKLKKLLII